MTPPREVPSASLFTRVLPLLWLAFALNYADRQAVFSIFPALSRDLGFTHVTFGLAGGIFTWVYSLSMPLTGRLADLFSRPRLIVLSVALWSCAMFGTAISGNIPTFLIWRGAMGITEALYMPAALGWIAALCPETWRSRALSVHATAQFAGIIAGASCAGWVADHIGWRTGFETAGLIGITYAVLLGVAFHRLPRGERPETTQSRALSIFEAPAFLVLAAAFFVFCFILWILYAWLPTYLFEHFHLSMSVSGSLAAISLQTSAAAGILIGGVLGDWFARKCQGGRIRVAAMGLATSAPCAWLVFAAGSVPALEIAAIAFGLCSGLFMANIFAATLDFIPQQNYGFAVSILNMAGGIAGGLGILLGGMSARFGFENLLALAAAVASCLGVLLFFQHRREAIQALNNA